MPQELRWPEFRTEEFIPEVCKAMRIFPKRYTPQFGMAVEAFWPKMTILDKELLLMGFDLLEDIIGAKR